MRREKLRKICLWAGACLLVAATVALLLWQWRIQRASGEMAETVASLQAIMPPAQSAVAEPRSDNEMPYLSLDGVPYVGILELPRYSSVLPVQARWGGISDSPCRYSGSIYDGTLQIGATTQRGQYDFYRELSLGDSVYFTDMAGNRYAYQITDLHYSDHADKETLEKYSGELLLFIKNVYGRQYLIVTCQKG